MCLSFVASVHNQISPLTLRDLTSVPGAPAQLPVTWIFRLNSFDMQVQSVVLHTKVQTNLSVTWLHNLFSNFSFTSALIGWIHRQGEIALIAPGLQNLRLGTHLKSLDRFWIIPGAINAIYTRWIQPISADVNEMFEKKWWSHMTGRYVRTFVCTPQTAE